jgi:hypothetical protein
MAGLRAVVLDLHSPATTAHVVTVTPPAPPTSFIQRIGSDDVSLKEMPPAKQIIQLHAYMPATLLINASLLQLLPFFCISCEVRSALISTSAALISCEARSGSRCLEQECKTILLLVLFRKHKAVQRMGIWNKRKGAISFMNNNGVFFCSYPIFSLTECLNPIQHKLIN